MKSFKRIANPDFTNGFMNAELDTSRLSPPSGSKALPGNRAKFRLSLLKCRWIEGVGRQSLQDSAFPGRSLGTSGNRILHWLSSAFAIGTMIVIITGCKNSSVTVSPTPQSNTSRVLTPAAEDAIVSFCSDCHAMPDPASFPKSAWDHEVRRGFDFYYASGRNNLVVPIFVDAQNYFVTRAPEALAISAPAEVDAAWLSRFQQSPIAIPGLKNSAISFVDVVELGGPLGRGILFSEMSRGGVYFAALTSAGQTAPAKLLANVGHPAVVRVCDWDGDGLRDLIVADLGSFLPEDHDRGRVVWLRQRDDMPGEFSTTVLQGSVGRISSVEIADFDSDGHLDLLVAEFGWQSTGSIFWLKRAETGAAVEGLTKHEIDPRSGTIHIPIVDINQDGHPDFIALISQHHERIEAMINDGRGQFQSKLIYAAPEPAFGSSGIDLVDINEDGKVDVLYSNGDSFDSLILKPSHGVRWLENKGEYPFELHELGSFPGAHRALVGDFEGDGKKSIVGGAFFAKDVLRTQGLEKTESLVIWKRDDGGNYTKHVLARGDCTHAAVCVADLDGNGRDDLVVGEFRDGNSGDNLALTVWLAR